MLAGIAVGLASLVKPLLACPGIVPRLGAIAAVAAFFILFARQRLHWPGRPGRVAQNHAWPVNADGAEAVEFRRGSSLWIATRDGQSICRRDLFEPTDGARPGW